MPIMLLSIFAVAVAVVVPWGLGVMGALIGTQGSLIATYALSVIFFWLLAEWGGSE